MKKSEIKKLDKMWADKVKELAEYKCQSCLEDGEFVRVEAAHIIGRNYRTTRWGCFIDGVYDIAGMCLCMDCHQHYDQHKQKADFIRRVVIGVERNEKLLDTKKTIAKNQDFKEIKGYIESC